MGGFFILKAFTTEASEVASPLWKPTSVSQPWSEGTASIGGSERNSACGHARFLVPYGDCQQGFQLVPAADCDNFKDWLSHHADL